MSIHYINNSSVVDATSFQQAIADINTQLSNEFAFAWGLPHIAATLTIQDTIDVQEALGYHDIDSQFHPYAKVAARLCLENGISPWIAASHEAMEMMRDPLLNSLALIDTSGGQGLSGELVWFEVCDAVERQSYPGRLYKTPLSNFVLPGWYVPGWGYGVDHLNKVPGPLTLASGGSVAGESFAGGGWQDYTAYLSHVVKGRKVHYL